MLNIICSIQLYENNYTDFDISNFNYLLVHESTYIYIYT